MLHSVAKSLWLPWPYRLLLMGLSVLRVCMCAWVRVHMCVYLIKKTISWMGLNSVSQKPKDFGAVFYIVSNKCSDLSLVVLLVLAVVLDMKLG